MSVRPELTTSMSPPNTPPLTEILERHAQLETQVGEIYVTFTALFADKPELRAMWRTMALEEGGHAAVVRAMNKGLLSGVFQPKSIVLPLDMLDALATRVAEYRRQAEAGVSLDQALHITWELECSELDFLRELLVSASHVGELGLPITMEERDDKHVGRLREVIQKYTSDEGLRREVKFLAAERAPG